MNIERNGVPAMVEQLQRDPPMRHASWHFVHSWRPLAAIKLVLAIDKIGCFRRQTAGFACFIP
jgi:hypothetical protein